MVADVWNHCREIYIGKVKWGRCLVNVDKGNGVEQECGYQTSCAGGSTTNLIKHVENIHDIKIQRQNSKRPLETPLVGPRQSTIQFPRRDTMSLAEIVARAAAVDGIALSAIAGSSEVQAQAKMHGHKLPKSEHTIKKLLFEFLGKVVEYKQTFNDFKSKQQKFSITTDEWTNMLGGSRMLGVTLRTKDESWKLGLHSIKGSIDAEDYVKCVEEKLEIYDLNFTSDIVCSTHDGAPMMAKFGRISDPESQICLNHGLHLGISKVLYTKENTSKLNVNDSRNDELLDSLSDDDLSDDDDSDDDTDDLPCQSRSEILGSLRSHFEIDDEQEDDAILVPELLKTLKEGRNLVKHFRESTVRNDYLQEFVQEGEKKKLKCLLDVKHRWNSMVKMCRRLLRLKPYMKKYLIRFGVNPLNYGERLFQNLQNIVDCLAPLEYAVVLLSSHTSNLLMADAVIKFVFDSLRKVNSDLSKKLCESLIENMLPRRKQDLVSLLRVLRARSFVVLSKSTPELKYSSRFVVIKTARSLYKRLFGCQEKDELEEALNSDSEDEDDAQEPIHLKEGVVDLQSYIDSEFSILENNASTDDIEQDFKKMKSFGELTPRLQNLYNALATIDPTSTPSEQTFSVSNIFVTKVRNKTGDDLLNALVVIKYYFLKKAESENENPPKKIKLNINLL